VYFWAYWITSSKFVQSHSPTASVSCLNRHLLAHLGFHFIAPCSQSRRQCVYLFTYKLRYTFIYWYRYENTYYIDILQFFNDEQLLSYPGGTATVPEIILLFLTCGPVIWHTANRVVCILRYVENLSPVLLHTISLVISTFMYTAKSLNQSSWLGDLLPVFPRMHTSHNIRPVTLEIWPCCDSGPTRSILSQSWEFIFLM